MFYALVHYPKVNTLRINEFRKLYDPQIKFIGPHITLMFPVPESIGEDNIVNHLAGVLSNWEPFPIRLQGLLKSSDNYLYLLVQEGSGNIVDLHHEIYTGLLAHYQKEDVPFVPHLTLGFFGENVDKYPKALEEAKRLNLDFRSLLDKVHLVKINDDRSQIVWSKEFLLG